MGVTQGEEVTSPACGQVGGVSSRLVVWLRVTVSIMGVDEFVGVSTELGSVQGDS